MKSEHRHELETNELSAGLAKSIEKLKPLTGQLLAGAGLLLAIYAGLSIWKTQGAKQERAAWEAYALATDSRDPEMKGLQRVAGDEEYAGTKMSEWAYVGWADQQVLRAMQNYFVADREKIQDMLSSVESVYQGFSTSASDPQVMNRARFGLARVYELQNKLDEARKQYLTVRGALQPQAVERAAELDTEAVRETIAWLASAALPKRDLTGGQGASGLRPGFDASVPSSKPSADSISAKSLEELLGELANEPAEESRFGEKDEAFKTDGTADGPIETEEASETETTEAESTETETGEAVAGEAEAAKSDTPAE